MNPTTAKTAALVAAIAFVLVLGTRLGNRAESSGARNIVGTATDQTTQAKIERAMSAGPPEIARSAKIIEKDAQGRIVVLREAQRFRSV